jgi:hypothetical protein
MVVAAIGTLVTGVNYLKAAWSWVFPVPSVAISASTPGSDVDALAVNFRFENTGSISLVDSEISCEISAANGHFRESSNFIQTRGRNSSQLVDRLDPGKSIVRNCGELLLNVLPFSVQGRYPIPQFPATFTITIKSQWPAERRDKTLSQTEQFLGIKDAGGHVVIERGT